MAGEIIVRMEDGVYVVVVYQDGGIVRMKPCPNLEWAMVWARRKCGIYGIPETEIIVEGALERASRD